MVCNDPYRNPAGLKFVTRVEFDSTTPEYVAAQSSPQVILNIPNGAGPGTLWLGARDTYVTYTVRDVKNLVRQNQRAYAGPSNFEEIYVEDGCIVTAILLDRSTLNHYDLDGIEENAPLQPLIYAEWFPTGTRVPSFSRLSLLSGPPGTATPYPFRTMAAGATLRLAPPGLCRYFSFGSLQLLDYRLVNITPATNPIYESIAGISQLTRAIPSWGLVELINNSGNLADVSVCWDRLPIGQ